MKFYRLEKPNMFKFWGYRIIKGIAIALILAVISMFVAGYKFMIVSSGSMEPVLPVGSLVIVTPCDTEDLELGDIVTMNAGGIYLTHRVVGKYNPNDPDGSVVLPEDVSEFEDKEWFKGVNAVHDDELYENLEYWCTKGDNSVTLDGALTREIVGKVHDNHAFGWVGTCVRYIRANYMMLIIILVIFVAFSWVMEWLKNQLNDDDIEVYENDGEEE